LTTSTTKCADPHAGIKREEVEQTRGRQRGIGRRQVADIGEMLLERRANAGANEMLDDRRGV
jgi:hypothetical protein